MERCKLDILGISEARWTSYGKTAKHKYRLYYSGHKETDAPHTLGVGIMMSPLAQKALITWEDYGPRLMTATFKTKNPNIKFHFIQCYAPTEGSDVEDKDAFYGLLQDVTSRFSGKDVMIVSGDLNAKVGADNRGHEEIMGSHGIGEDNDNGDRLMNFCNTNGLVIGGTIFPHKDIHKVTWISPDDKTENQIDHICINRRFRRTLQDVKVARGADIGSDHNLVIGKLRLTLKKFAKKNETRKKYNVTSLRNPKIKQEFSIELKNRFEALTELPEDIDEHWSKIKDIYNSVCEETLGLKTQNRKEWISQESWDKIEERRVKKAKWNNARTRMEKTAAREEYSSVNRETKGLLKKDKRKFVEDLAERAEEAAGQGNWREVYQTTKILSGKFGRGEIPVKDAAGKSLPGQEAQKTRWEEHFSNLLNRPPPTHPPDIQPAVNDLDINCDPPTEEEIELALNKLKNGKAAGGDFIPPEALKADVPTTTRALHSLFQKVWDAEKSPKEWKEGHLIKLPKKGDLRNCNNYRGIMLLSVPGKVLSRIILERMKDKVDGLLRNEQAGFRKGRSCADQIATLRIILQQSLEWNASLYMNFVDYEKAFDSVDRTTLWKLLRHFGVPQKLVNIIKESYEGFNCKIVHEGSLTNSFQVNTGVRQGCLLSPFLFLLAIGWVMKSATENRRNGIQWTLFSQLDDLDFADDIALLSQSGQQMQDKTTAIKEVSECIGLKVHPGKSKVMRVKTPSTEPILLGEEALEDVESFTYLGSVIDKKGGVTADIRSRIGKARQNFGRLKPVWRSRKLTTKTKLRIFNSNIKAVLLYGSETWCLTQTNGKRLQTFVNGCLRYILNIRYPDRIRNVDLWERTGQEPVLNDIGRRRWRWLGHTLRKAPEDRARQALRWNPQGARRRGRPAQSWRRDLEAEIERMDLSWREISEAAQDRDEWKMLVRGLYSGASSSEQGEEA